MPIPTPSQILDKLVQNRQAVADRIVDQISKILEEEFIGDPIEIWIYETEQDAEQVTKLIAPILYAQGWSIKTGEKFTDPRSGDSIMFVISPIDSSDPALKPNT